MTNTTCPRCTYDEAEARLLHMAEEAGTLGKFRAALDEVFLVNDKPAHRAECPADPENLRHSCGCYKEDNMGGHAPDCDALYAAFNDEGRDPLDEENDHWRAQDDEG